MSHREGIHGCDPAGKTSITVFKMLGYDADSDTSLVECRPITGRTHQLRIHLQAMGNSIANDPCYGGELFYGEPEKRFQALEVLRKMRREGKHPLSKVPHLGDPELDLKPLPLARTAQTSSSSSSASSSSSSASGAGGQTALAGDDSAEAAPVSAFADVVEPQQPGEGDTDYLVRTCKYCRQEKESQELERLLHCDGIWLHALRYKGDGWGFRAPEPKWALLDAFGKVQ
jgi:RNA pseudouridylate synthase